jgi:thiamine biosynthesis lipoprotein
MGSDAHVVAEGDADVEHALYELHRLLEDLERRWSRFAPTSELSAINGNAPYPARVSAPTFELIRLSVEGWRRTGGRFDPTVGAAVIGNGYTRSFREMSGQGRVTPSLVASATGCAAVAMDEIRRTVAVPTGTLLDLGGVGKGRAADLGAALVAGDGKRSVCVNLGGDARMVGGAHINGGWTIAVEDPLDQARALTTLAVRDGAVATSARTRRRWLTPQGERHHLVDPATGAPARTGLAQVTVLAAEAAWAEMVAKAAFVAGVRDGPDLVERSGAAALFVSDDGDLIRAGGFEAFER